MDRWFDSLEGKQRGISRLRPWLDRATHLTLKVGFQRLVNVNCQIDLFTATLKYLDRNDLYRGEREEAKVTAGGEEHMNGGRIPSDRLFFLFPGKRY
jgi:hypothetical protein